MIAYSVFFLLIFFSPFDLVDTYIILNFQRMSSTFFHLGSTFLECFPFVPIAIKEHCEVIAVFHRVINVTDEVLVTVGTVTDGIDSAVGGLIGVGAFFGVAFRSHGLYLLSCCTYIILNRAGADNRQVAQSFGQIFGVFAY
jgi:hypothetical protein